MNGRPFKPKSWRRKRRPPCVSQFADRNKVVDVVNVGRLNEGPMHAGMMRESAEVQRQFSEMREGSIGAMPMARTLARGFIVAALAVLACAMMVRVVEVFW